MKKLLLLATALLTLNTVNANLLIHESFDREVGNLYKDDFQNMGNNTTDWFWFLSGSADIQVTAGSLTYPGYVDGGIGNKANLKGGSGKYKDLRQYAKVTNGTVYVAAIINVETLKNAATADYFLALGDGTSSNMYARVYTSSVKEGNDWVGFKFGIQKNNENSGARGYSETIYSVNTDYLIVAEYQFVDGAQNDTVRLYVNPTKNNKVPVAQCGQVFMIGDNNKGAGAQPDAAYLSSVNLRPSTATPTSMHVDEIKVATAWEDLFAGESGETPVEEPEITATPAILQFGGQVFVGSTYTTKFVVKGKNLNGDITLTSSNAELTLDKTTIAKIDAESENGAEVVATLKPTAETYARETVTLTSQDAKDVVLNTSWYAVAIVSCSTLAEAKKAAANASGWDEIYIRYTGEAVVTYAVTEEIIGYTYNLKYIEDNTAAIRVSDVYWTGVKQGDKITGFVLQAKDPTQNDVPVVTAFGADATIISSGNDVTPQVVTLADLKNNADDYLYELVKVEGVTFADNENWKSGAQIKQGENTAVVNLISGNELINTPKPAKADIIGISKSTTGAVLCVRGKQDVVAAPTAIENIAADSEVEIYTVSGMRVSELQPGVNIIRQGNKTFKVVR